MQDGIVCIRGDVQLDLCAFVEAIVNRPCSACIVCTRKTSFFFPLFLRQFTEYFLSGNIEHRICCVVGNRKGGKRHLQDTSPPPGPGHLEGITIGAVPDLFLPPFVPHIVIGHRSRDRAQVQAPEARFKTRIHHPSIWLCDTKSKLALRNEV